LEEDLGERGKRGLAVGLAAEFTGGPADDLAGLGVLDHRGPCEAVAVRVAVVVGDEVDGLAGEQFDLGDDHGPGGAAGYDDFLEQAAAGGDDAARTPSLALLPTLRSPSSR
jgi:hypothetical protein